jgi:hypothetical protein
MRRARFAVAVAFGLVLGACVETRTVSVTFGAEGEGLDGFLCSDAAKQPLLKRLVEPDGGVGPTSLVVDFVRLGGVPGCRTGQLVKWCAAHDCRPIEGARACVEVELPVSVPSAQREDLRAALLEALKTVDATRLTSDAPDEFVLVRVVGSAQRCEALLPPAASGPALQAFDAARLVGCAYSCPVLLGKVEQDVYLGFETLVGQCEQGVRICADGELHWQP